MLRLQKKDEAATILHMMNIRLARNKKATFQEKHQIASVKFIRQCTIYSDAITQEE